MSSRRDRILLTLEDSISGFLYYDRKEDEDLPVGSIEEAISNGEIPIEEMVSLFRSHLTP